MAWACSCCLRERMSPRGRAHRPCSWRWQRRGQEHTLCRCIGTAVRRSVPHRFVSAGVDGVGQVASSRIGAELTHRTPLALGVGGVTRRATAGPADEHCRRESGEGYCQQPGAGQHNGLKGPHDDATGTREDRVRKKAAAGSAGGPLTRAGGGGGGAGAPGGVARGASRAGGPGEAGIAAGAPCAKVALCAGGDAVDGAAAIAGDADCAG